MDSLFASPSEDYTDTVYPSLRLTFRASSPIIGPALNSFSNNYSLKEQPCQLLAALAPRDRYQVMEAILTKGGASPLKRLWEKIKKEEPHLWQTLCHMNRIEARKHLVHKCYLSPLAYLPQRGMRLRENAPLAKHQRD